MKTTILYSLVLLTMLGIGLSCKKVIEEVKPPVVTKPGSSTTPTSTTPVVMAPDLINKNCRYPLQNLIVKVVTWEESGQVFKDIPPKEFEIGGKKRMLNRKRETSYIYDTNRKLVMEFNIYSDPAFDTVRYTYTSNYFSRHVSYYFNKKLARVQKDSVSLDRNGFPLKTFDGENILYGIDGYIISISSKDNKSLNVKNGNITKRIISALEGSGNIIISYDYDSTQIMLPTPFIGYSSKNQVLQETISLDGPAPYYLGDVYKNIYEYKISNPNSAYSVAKYGIRLEPNYTIWPFDTKPTVTEYHYQCK
jgi:hypothetical protein